MVCDTRVADMSHLFVHDHSHAPRSLARETSRHRTFLDQAHVDGRLAALAGGQHGGVWTLDQIHALRFECIRRPETGSRHRATPPEARHRLLPGATGSAQARGALDGGCACVRSRRGPLAPLRRALHELRHRAGTTFSHRSRALQPRQHEGIGSTARPRSPPKTSPRSTTSPAQPSPAPSSTSATSSPSASSSAPSTRPRSRTTRSQRHRRPAHQNPTRPAAKAVRNVLETHYIGRTPTWNENEEALLAITRKLGIPDPDTNAFVILDDVGPPITADSSGARGASHRGGQRKWHTSPQRLESARISRPAADRGRLEDHPHGLEADDPAAARAAAAAPQATAAPGLEARPPDHPLPAPEPPRATARAGGTASSRRSPPVSAASDVIRTRRARTARSS